MDMMKKRVDSNYSRIVVMSVLEMLNDGEDYPIKATGSSMKPFIRDGDTLIISALKKDEISTGDILLYERDNGQFVFHRLYKIEADNTFSFVGDNQFSVEKGIRENQILAKVVKIIHEGRVIECNSIAFRTITILYMRFRVNLFLVLHGAKIKATRFHNFFKEKK